ncbi:hypothetical protein T492DRAFT_621367, partial [Pavlovales sp. CCMP2436]
MGVLRLLLALAFSCVLVGASASLAPATAAGRAPIASRLGERRARVAMGTVKVNFKPSGNSIEMAGGSALSLAAYEAGERIAFNCKMGKCATCEVKMGGKKVRTCVTNLPS